MDLTNLGVQEMSVKEVVSVDGGNIFYDWLVGTAIGAVIDFIAYDNEAYGEWLIYSGSNGGAK